MIHQLIVIDREKSVGITLFNDHELRLQADLLIGLVQALMMLGEEMGPVKGSLREAELGKYQLSILSRDHLIYVAIQDSYDSEPFTKTIIEKVVFRFHQTFAASNLNIQLRDESDMRKEVAELLQTMKFPVDLIPEVKGILDKFIDSQAAYIDTMFLTDLDDGIVDIHLEPSNDTIIRLLMEILSEIPFERHWIGQSKLHHPIVIENINYDYELWLIYRIADTDFCIMGRAYYREDADRGVLIQDLEDLTTEIASRIM